MKKTAALLLAAVLGLAGVAVAGEIQGRVRSIDTASQELVLDDGTTLAWDESTTILVQGREGNIEDLKEGTKVNASYEEKDGKNVAAELEVAE